jgi:hypothetical protein
MLGNSVYLMFLSRFIVKCKKEIEIWAERGHERTRYTVLPDPSPDTLFIICKEGRECNVARICF